ncbi:cell shape determination protein CcmA [Halovibrio salipaludis]|uniref:Cell shape determination protein CcmA n=1 Tax=Halovibrio salipaludis TaxID=2032626 RepID=A0A2A2EXI2_9GAMM|nr:polymer-forming cytoskeletal protein [Halovibrio salipaludis]PAU77095.1 cell shape determination protein CcmA [Halovibrio salipaludis]
MFRKSRTINKGSGQYDTLVSNKMSITGDVHFSGGLHIDGRVEGTVYAEEGSDAVLRISDVGEVVGDVYAPHIIINGTVHGNVYSSEDLELASKASIHGNVYYHLIEMAMGAAVNGSLLHQREGGLPGGSRTLPSGHRQEQQESGARAASPAGGDDEARNEESREDSSESSLERASSV